MAFIEKCQGDLIYMVSDIMPVRHGFTTRYGGVSTGKLAQLNLGENRGDDPDRVRENYRRIGAALGIDTEKLVYPRQVHGHTVRVVQPEDRRALFTDIPYEADGLVTNMREQPLIVYTADCVPVLLADKESGVIGAVHCGWRSSVQDILGCAVGEMVALGARPDQICAAIGPAIGACCFETGPEVPAALDQYLSGDRDGLYYPVPGKTEKFMVDLRAANRRRLLQLGLRPERIDVSQECTMCSHEKYWSHRYTKGERGSQGALIVLD
jgi:YfiH family protein